MEEDAYLAGWRQRPDGFELWLKKHPRIRATGKSYLEAEEALLEAIGDAFGVYVAALEFVPPLPKSEFDARYSTPELYTICGDDRFEMDEPRRIPFETAEECAARQPWYDQWFVAPFCRACGTAAKPRNESPLQLTYVRGAYDGGFVILANACLCVFSERFLELLARHELESLEFRPVDRPKRSRKQFFELIGPSGLPLVALAGHAVTGWHCSSCGTRNFGHYSAETNIHRFVAKSDLPDPLPQVFTIGARPNVQLCVTADRWAKLVGQRGTRGLITSLVGVAPDDEVVRLPDLKPRADSR